MGPTPYCSWLSRDGMVARFRLVCESAERLIIFYDVPGRTGLHIEMDTYRRLAVCLVLLVQALNGQGRFDGGRQAGSDRHEAVRSGFR